MVMGITATDLARRFPKLYHMAEAGSWPSIQEHGLLSTSALLALFEVNGDRRKALEASHRPECVSITHGIHGTAVIRDQKPMDDIGLRKALSDGLTPSQWYRILNAKVFFWLSIGRLNTLLSAKAYRNKRHTVLVLNSARLLERHADRVMLCPMNSGCTKPFPHPRGKSTFLPLAQYPFDEWDRKRRGIEPAVELTVEGGVPDAAEFVLTVEEQGAGQPTQLLWKRT
jgi:hypothetical protein